MAAVQAAIACLRVLSRSCSRRSAAAFGAAFGAIRLRRACIVWRELFWLQRHDCACSSDTHSLKHRPACADSQSRLAAYVLQLGKRFRSRLDLTRTFPSSALHRAIRLLPYPNGSSADPHELSFLQGHRVGWVTFLTGNLLHRARPRNGWGVTRQAAIYALRS